VYNGHRNPKERGHFALEPEQIELQSLARQQTVPRQKKTLRAQTETRALALADDAAARYRSYLYALAYKLAVQLDELVTACPLAALAESKSLKLRDITGAVKDIEEALHLASDADLAEQAARVEKLRREALPEARETGIQVVMSPEAESYGK